MIIRTAVLSFAISFAFASAAGAEETTVVVQTAPVTQPAPVTPPENTQATSPMTEADVRALLTANGYTKVNDVEFKDGTWTADAESADDRHVEVRIDSATRKIIPDEPVATISKDAITRMVGGTEY